MRRAPDLNRIRPAEPDMVRIKHLETPVSFTLLPATLAVNFGEAGANLQLTH